MTEKRTCQGTLNVRLTERWSEVKFKDDIVYPYTNNVRYINDTKTHHEKFYKRMYILNVMSYLNSG